MSQPPSAPIGLLEGRIAVITGAGTGIGRVTAETFVREGAKVVVADVSGRQADTAAALGSDAVAVQVDVRDEAQVEAMFRTALDVFGRVDASIHVAGNPGGRRTLEITAEEFDSLTDVHLLGTMLCCKHAGRVMQDGVGGAIVNFSSVGSLGADHRVSMAYAAAKAGVNSLTKSFALQYGPRGIRVNAVLPGFTMSEKNRGIPADTMAALSASAALGRPAEPRETADVTAFLASDRASFVSGVILPVDGGWSIRMA